ncbi:MAG: hypothetical protein V3T17_09775 [Pseudomonadales bacterium]
MSKFGQNLVFTDSTKKKKWSHKDPSALKDKYVRTLNEFRASINEKVKKNLTFVELIADQINEHEKKIKRFHDEIKDLLAKSDVQFRLVYKKRYKQEARCRYAGPYVVLDSGNYTSRTMVSKGAFVGFTDADIQALVAGEQDTAHRTRLLVSLESMHRYTKQHDRLCRLLEEIVWPSGVCAGGVPLQAIVCPYERSKKLRDHNVREAVLFYHRLWETFEEEQMKLDALMMEFNQQAPRRYRSLVVRWKRISKPHTDFLANEYEPEFGVFTLFNRHTGYRQVTPVKDFKVKLAKMKGKEIERSRQSGKLTRSIYSKGFLGRHRRNLDAIAVQINKQAVVFNEYRQRLLPLLNLTLQ